MSNTIKSLLIFITVSALFGCSASRYISSIFHEQVVLIFSSSSYPDEIFKSKTLPPRQATLIFGPYMPNLGDGGGAFGGDSYSYEGAIEGKEIVALWQVPVKDKVLRYYVRSERGKGITRAAREGSYSFSVGVALGPMRVLKGGLTEEQFGTSEIVDYTFSGKPHYYRWGSWDKLYYTTGIFFSRDLKTKPHTFHEIQGISITAEQYDKLYKRCYGEWKKVKCFMDESFPNLTPDQLAYIQSRKHPDDDDRLAGKFPKPKPYINPYN